jgi:hypothetical protein
MINKKIEIWMKEYENENANKEKEIERNLKKINKFCIGKTCTIHNFFKRI